jgi:uncharacterized membrane protein YvbJ
MSYCSKCGAELKENSAYCSMCGSPVENPGFNGYQYQYGYQPQRQESGIAVAAKIFMIIGTISLALSTFLIGLIWALPMTIHYFNKIKMGQDVGLGFKICTILFVNTIAGILMLCDRRY